MLLIFGSFSGNYSKEIKEKYNYLSASLKNGGIMLFQKQLMMRKVVYSLFPIYLAAVFFYGIYFFIVSIAVFAAGIMTEYLFMKYYGKKISEAVLVTCMIYLLSLPPEVPVWIAATGIVFGVLFGKCVYGGFGRNIFNPAITGRLFIYITFPGKMTSLWTVPSFFGFGKIDGIASATPLYMMRQGEIPELLNLFTGLRTGSAGEGFTVLIILAAVYLIYTKTANWKAIASTLASFLVFSTLFFLIGAENSFPPIHAVLSGSILFVAVFMVTDPVSAPKKPQAILVYGLMVGGIAALVRTFSLFPEGTSFGILIGNTFASLFDEWFPKPALKKPPVKKADNPGNVKPVESSGAAADKSAGNGGAKNSDAQASPGEASGQASETGDKHSLKGGVNE